MKHFNPSKILQLAVAYIIGIIIIAHFLTPPEYHWTRNTISELAAQQTPYQWVMQAGLIGFGVMLASGLAWRAFSLRKISAGDIGVFGWGVSILLAGIFSTAPYIEGVTESVRESQLHSLFATMAGISLSLGIFAHIFTAPKTDKFSHLIFFLLVIGLSGAFGLAESGYISIGEGIIQRVLWLTGFIWVIWAYADRTPSE